MQEPFILKHSETAIYRHGMCFSGRHSVKKLKNKEPLTKMKKWIRIKYMLKISIRVIRKIKSEQTQTVASSDIKIHFVNFNCFTFTVRPLSKLSLDQPKKYWVIKQ